MFQCRLCPVARFDLSLVSVVAAGLQFSAGFETPQWTIPFVKFCHHLLLPDVPVAAVVDVHGASAAAVVVSTDAYITPHLSFHQSTLNHWQLLYLCMI